MRGNLDFSSWQGVLTTLLGLVIVSVVAIGIRLLLMHGVQLRRERQNRQINERLKTLISAYKTLGGSFTGELVVDPRHLRDQRQSELSNAGDSSESPGSDRSRRTRDAVEAALSDVILLGTQEQVRLAAHAANEMVAGRAVETAALVTSLRDFIREVLDLESIPSEIAVPRQGPTRAGNAASRGGRGEKGGGKGGGGGGGAGGEGAGQANAGAAPAVEPDDPLPG